MKPESRRRCIASMRTVNIRISGKAMLESGLLRHNVRARCLLRTPTAERWKLLCSKSGLKTNSWAVYRKDTSSPWTTRRFIKKRFYITCGKILAGTVFSAAVFTWIQSYWAHVERFEAKGCWLCSSIWFRFTGFGCRFKRQLAICLNLNK